MFHVIVIYVKQSAPQKAKPLKQLKTISNLETCVCINMYLLTQTHCILHQ